jgi:hypothetical protein
MIIIGKKRIERLKRKKKDQKEALSTKKQSSPLFSLFSFITRL